MNSFLKSKITNSRREDEIKKNITTQLSETVKDIQLSSIENTDSMEGMSNLCSVIEAMFLHGLKDSLAHRFRRVLADVDQRPDPNFWSPLLIISHRQIIEQITKLTQIVTEIGQCRAWVRIALNDALLSSYFMIIKQDPSSVKSYYNTHAYIRDVELLEVAQKLIEGVEAIKLVLPCNSSLLNSWPLPTLILAGIWAPTLRSCPISSGVDVAQSLQATSSINSETCSIGSIVSQSSGIGQMLEFNHDEALKIILAKSSDEEEISEKRKVVQEAYSASPKSNEAAYSESNSIGNSLNRQSGWSFDENHIKSEENESEKVENHVPMEHSFNALVENSYNIFAETHIRTPDFKEVWQRLEASPKRYQSDKPNPPKEVVQEINVSPPKVHRISLTTQVQIIPKERGLDSQDYKCYGCKETILLNSKYSVCHFNGDYFCDTCMAKDLIPIPARIIHNWDFKKYPISQKSFNFLEEIKDNPVIDFKTSNPFIYSAVDGMAKLQTLRNQLNYLRAYLYTCREPIIEELQKMMWPREYMYEHIHQYSISDLLQIKDGSLAQQLENVVEFGTNHVLNCWLCSQKGFLCELCNQSKPLFPFDTKNVYRCTLCSGVYHKTCLNALKPCPRCKRRKDRDDLLPLLEATLDEVL